MWNVHTYALFVILFQYVVLGYLTISVDAKEVLVDWSKCLANFTPFTLFNFPHLLILDLSGCNRIIPDELVDSIGFLQELQVLNLDRCDQFTHYHFVKIFQQLKKLITTTLLECTRIPFTSAYTICCSLPHLQKIDFEPFSVKQEMKDWRHLIAIFFKVKFGANFTSKVFDAQ